MVQKTSYLRHLREQKGWTQQELAERVGCAQTMISAIENYRSKPRKQLLKSYCQALGITTEEFEKIFNERWFLVVKKLVIQATVETKDEDANDNKDKNTKATFGKRSTSGR